MDCIALDGQLYGWEDTDMRILCNLGHGTHGAVEKVHHRPSNAVMALKRIPLTVNKTEQKKLVIDLDTAMKSGKCSHIVQYYGAVIGEGVVWLCMEVMDTSLAHLCDIVYKETKSSIPENVLGKIAISVVKGLHYLNSTMKIPHRDVKPSNILVNRKGEVKICDFGVSGHLVDSVQKTRESGCKPYMAPERINPESDVLNNEYSICSDIWSFGITMVELATGTFPYEKWVSPIQQLQQVVDGDPPRLPPDKFSKDIEDFVAKMLTKKVEQRATCVDLLEHPFVKKYEEEDVDMAGYFSTVMEKQCDLNENVQGH
ncbi:dual specificity mitogen-activated protein kinase kinase 6-like [Liolophura sinensis]|uniref:dual specificity mitogen-activated protein kinase kinase 6-like n=1 Tax=Liolophura sinensis TaxID=3198878 RepID=UPI0031593DDB